MNKCIKQFSLIAILLFAFSTILYAWCPPAHGGFGRRARRPQQQKKPTRAPKPKNPIATPTKPQPQQPTGTSSNPVPTPIKQATPTQNTPSTPSTASDDTSATVNVKQPSLEEINLPLWEQWWELNKIKYLPLSRDIYFLEETIKKEGSDDEEIIVKPEYNKVLEFFKKCLKDKKNEAIRYSAILSLAKTNDKKVIDIIRPMLDDSKRNVYQTTLLAFGILKDKTEDDLNEIREALKYKELHVVAKGFAAYAAALLKDAESLPLFDDILNDKQEPLELRGTVAYLLGNFNNEQVEELLIKITENEKKYPSSVIANAIIALGNLKTNDAIQKVLKDAVNNKHGEISQSAVIAMGNSGEKEYLDTLQEALKNSKDPMTKAFSAISIGMLGNNSSVDLLVEIATSRRALHERGFAIIALGILGDKSASEHLEKIFNNKGEWPTLRAAAVTAMAMIGDVKCIKEIKEIAQKKQYPKLSKYCISALAIMKDDSLCKSMTKILKKEKADGELIDSICYYLSVSGKRNDMMKIISKRIKSKKTNKFMKNILINALGRYGDLNAIDLLLDVEGKLKYSDNKLKEGIITSLGLLLDRNYKMPIMKKFTISNNYMISSLISAHIYAIP